MVSIQISDQAAWRDVCRKLLSAELDPANVMLFEETNQQGLFASSDCSSGIPDTVRSTSFTVPKPFLSLVENVGYHRNDQRWNLLYRMLWRLTHGEPHLLELATDEDVCTAMRMQKQVTRDAHKAKAFIRFRKVEREGEEHFIAWHQPDHRILRKIAPFFSRRFKAMNWTILTPFESAFWNQTELTYGEGVSRSAAPDGDSLEELWKTYYASIFNPSRIKIKMMKSEMPVRYWHTLPEAELIDDLIAEAPDRVKEMIERQEGFDSTAVRLIQTIPEANRTIEALRTVAKTCQVCDLHRDATQTVFGAGRPDAPLVIVGEQPGDQEDLHGQPFIGPAGQLLRELLTEADLSLNDVYLTNVVKHFKHKLTSTPRGKKRLHQRPDAREIRCCKPWLEAELEMIHPKVLLLLGATAGQAILGKNFRLTDQRGSIQQSEYCSTTIASWHPAAILRQPDEQRSNSMREQLLTDIRNVASRV